MSVDFIYAILKFYFNEPGRYEEYVDLHFREQISIVFSGENGIIPFEIHSD